MTKIDKHIEIVSSSIDELSSMDEISYSMIQDALSKYYTKVGVTLVNTDADLAVILKKNPDVVFMGAKRVPNLKSTNGQTEYTWLSDFLDDNNIPYTGSDGNAHRLDNRKNEAKDVVAAAGLDTARYFITSKGKFTDKSQLPLEFPLFIKPPFLGGGVGIGPDSVVRNFAEFTAKVASLHDEFQSDSLVETYLTGREFTVAILDASNRSQLQTLPIEMLPEENAHGDRIIGSAMKIAAVKPAVAAIADAAIAAAVTYLARSVFMAIGARDYGRIDIRLDENNKPHFLEANLIPSIINNSGNFQKACLINLGLDYEPMLLHIVDLALTRANHSEL